MDAIINIVPDKEKAKSILKMAELRLEMLGLITDKRYASPLAEQYYEIIKELTTGIMCAQGFKTLSHVALIDFMRKNYKSDFSAVDLYFIDQLRKTRNRIAYNGYFVDSDFIDQRETHISGIISKLKIILGEITK